MLVSNAAEAQTITNFNAEYSPSQVSNQITGQVNGAHEAGLAHALENDPNLFTTKDNAQVSSLLAEKPAGQVVDLTPDIAKATLDDAKLSMNSYQDSGAPEGYTRLSQEELNAAVGENVMLSDDESGFAAAVYKNNETGEVTVAYRGSEANNWQEFQNDWLESDIGQAFFNVPESYKQGSVLAGQIQQAYGDETNVSLTGHSLGGGIANYAAIDHNMDYTAFNAAGLAKHTVDSLGDKVDNYTGSGTIINDEYDPLTNYGGKFNDETWGNDAKHIGYDNLVFIDNDSFNSWWDTAFNFNKRVDAHNLVNVLPALEEYAAMA